MEKNELFIYYFRRGAGLHVDLHDLHPGGAGDDLDHNRVGAQTIRSVVEEDEGVDGATAESLGADHGRPEKDGHEQGLVQHRPQRSVRAARPQEDAGPDAAGDQAQVPQEQKQEGVGVAEGSGGRHEGNRGTLGAAENHSQNCDIRIFSLNLRNENELFTRTPINFKMLCNQNAFCN